MSPEDAFVVGMPAHLGRTPVVAVCQDGIEPDAHKGRDGRPDVVKLGRPQSRRMGEAGVGGGSRPTPDGEPGHRQLLAVDARVALLPGDGVHQRAVQLIGAAIGGEVLDQDRRAVAWQQVRSFCSNSLEAWARWPMRVEVGGS